eukprot:jgi/Bigna1/66526/fgenesh1_pg.1_\
MGLPTWAMLTSNSSVTRIWNILSNYTLIFQAVVADALARFARIHPGFSIGNGGGEGKDDVYGREDDCDGGSETPVVRFATGTDEHGQKIEATAARLNTTPKAIADTYCRQFQNLYDRLNISHDVWTRTTDPKHQRVAKAVFDRLRRNGDIYYAAYEGWYNTREERFVPLAEARASQYRDTVTGENLTLSQDDSYFFNMSRDIVATMTDTAAIGQFLQPPSMIEYVLNRLRSERLRDLSISRSSLAWGIPLPHPDEERSSSDDKAERTNKQQQQEQQQHHTMYVWLDALANYLTAANVFSSPPMMRHDEGGVGEGLAVKEEKEENLLSANHSQQQARDASVVWPCVLLALDMKLPHCIFAHGFVNDKNGLKMSKSVGNVVTPEQLFHRDVTSDALRFYLLRSSPELGGDVSFDSEALKAMLEISCTGSRICAGDMQMMVKSFTTLRLQGACNIAIRAAQDTNRFLTHYEPWNKTRYGGTTADNQRRLEIIRVSCEALYAIAHFLGPLIPNTATEMLRRLGMSPSAATNASRTFALHDLRTDFSNLAAGTPLLFVVAGYKPRPFPRFYDGLSLRTRRQSEALRSKFATDRPMPATIRARSPKRGAGSGGGGVDGDVGMSSGDSHAGTSKKAEIAESRYACIVLVALTSLGGSFSRDVIAAVSPQVRKRFGLSHAQYATVASLQGLPNVVLAFVTGAFVDYIGYRKSSLSFTFMVAAGTLLVLISSLSGAVWMLIAGQLTIGIGKQVVSVAQKVAFPHLAATKHMAVSLGLNLTFNRIGSSLGWALSPFLVDEETGHCAPAMALSFALCLVSFVGAACLFLMTREPPLIESPPSRKDQHSRRHHRRPPHHHHAASRPSSIELKVMAKGKISSAGAAMSGDQQQQPHHHNQQQLSAISIETPSRPSTDGAGKNDDSERKNSRSMRLEGGGRKRSCGSIRLFGDVLASHRRYGDVLLLLLAIQGRSFRLVIALEFLMEDRGLTETSADELIALIAIVPIAGCFLVGLMVGGGEERVSSTLEMGMVVNVLSMLALHNLIGYELVGIVLLGIADSLVCTSGWTLIPQVVHPRRRGLAVGLVHALENSWDVPLNSLFGWMRDKSGYVCIQHNQVHAEPFKSAPDGGTKRLLFLMLLSGITTRLFAV